MTYVNMGCPHPSDATEDIMLFSDVQCVQKLLKVVLGLAKKHRQQLLALCMWCLLTANGFLLSVSDNCVRIKFVKKTGIRNIQCRCQEIVILRNSWSMVEFFVELCCKRTRSELVQPSVCNRSSTQTIRSIGELTMKVTRTRHHRK